MSGRSTAGMWQVTHFSSPGDTSTSRGVTNRGSSVPGAHSLGGALLSTARISATVPHGGSGRKYPSAGRRPSGTACKSVRSLLRRTGAGAWCRRKVRGFGSRRAHDNRHRSYLLLQDRSKSELGARRIELRYHCRESQARDVPRWRCRAGGQFLQICCARSWRQST